MQRTSAAQSNLRGALLIVLLLFAGCSKPESHMTRILEYAREKQIVYLTDFPLYLRVDIVGVPDLRVTIETWLLNHGFKKGLGAAFKPDGTQISQQYLFGDTFDISIAALGENITVRGYGIRTPDENIDRTLKNLLEFIETHYQTTQKELKGL